MRRLIGADTETVDPCLKAHGKTKARGYSWKYGQGKILCTALYDLQNDSIEVLAGLRNSNTPYSEEERKVQNDRMIGLLKDPEVSLVGANILYDIGWWCYEYNLTTSDIKCRFIDVLQAEHILNEFDKDINLDDVSKKYLKFGKTKDRIEDWVYSSVDRVKGDFRGYLEQAPWDLLVEYVSGDAKNPCLIWRKQLTLLKEQDLCERCKLEFDMILPTLQMTMNGLKINRSLKEVLCKEFTEYMKKYSALFQEKFGEYAPKGFKPTSGKQIAKICEAMHIPFKDKITLKGMDGEPFRDYRDTDEAMRKARRLVSSFRFVKSIPVAYVPHELSERTCDILKEHGFLFTCNPNCDKKFFAAQKDNYEVIDIIANWKVALGILSKILGEEYNRFICPDGRIRGQFKITDTVSFRYSSQLPNLQQVPSKGSLAVLNNDVAEIRANYPHLASALVQDNDGNWSISFPAITRALFIPSEGKIIWKIDYGQIEYRLICHFAVGEGSKEVREEFARNPHLDFHQYVVDLTGLSRKLAKNMSFGVSFGMKLPSMCETFGWTLERGEEISEAYHRHMPFVAPTLALVGDVAKKRGYIKTVLGSHARLPNPNKSYTMLNRLTQGSGAEILKASNRRAYEEGLWEKLNTGVTVHDELDGEIYPTEEQILNVFRMAEIMTTTVQLKVPLEASPEFGMNWASTKEVSEWIKLKNKNDVEYTSQPQVLKDAICICERLIKEEKIKIA